MKKLSILLILLLIATICMSQTVYGVVLDKDENVLFGVSIYNTATKQGTITDVNGSFTINAKVGQTLTFTYVGKKTKYYSLQRNDTNLIFLHLQDDITNLKEFVVDGKRIKNVSSLKNENVLDYYSLGINTFLLLKSTFRNYILSIEGIDTVYKTYSVENVKPKSLFQDVFGNFHLICKDDSVRQFYFDSTLVFVESISLGRFKNLIKPLIYINDSVLISYKFKQHNKYYGLFLNKANSSKVLYYAEDEIARKVSQQTYNEIITLYYNCIPENTNVIANGTWDGNLISLQCGGLDITVLIWWYLKIRGREINVETFSMYNSLLTFDCLNDSVIVQNLNGDILHKTKLIISNKGFTKKVVLDREQKTFYGYSINDGVVTLDKIDLQTGNVTNSYELNGVTFPENLKVIDGWAYFIKLNKNGYHKLYRIELR